METIRHLAGLWGALLGTAVPTLVATAAVPQGACRWFSCTGPPARWPIGDRFVLPPPWQPFIGNPAPGEAGPRCPADPPSDTSFAVLEAPLPETFDTWRRAAVLACIRVGRWGRIDEVRLIGAPVAAEAELIRTIREGWTLVPVGLEPPPAGWQRVRLTRGGDYPGGL